MLFLTAALVLAALFQATSAQSMQINTIPSVVQCQPMQFTWSGGTPPYYLSLIPAGQVSAAPIKQFPVQQGTTMTWLVDLPAGQAFSSALRDSTGVQAFSDGQTVQTSPDNGCLSSSMSAMPGTTSSSSGTSAATIGAATTSSTGTATTTPGVTPVHLGSTTESTSKGTASSGASSTPTPTATVNAASLQRSAGGIGMAGLLGLAGAALLG